MGFFAVVTAILASLFKPKPRPQAAVC
jgi:hypothetical protein